MLRHFSELVNIPVREFCRAVWVAVFNRNVEQPIFAAAVYRGVFLKYLPSIRKKPLVILLHKSKMLDHRVFDSAALQLGHDHVIRGFQPETAPGKRGHPSEIPKLRCNCAAHG